jgi:hypothetical protein
VLTLRQITPEQYLELYSLQAPVYSTTYTPDNDIEDGIMFNLLQGGDANRYRFDMELAQSWSVWPYLYTLVEEELSDAT